MTRMKALVRRGAAAAGVAGGLVLLQTGSALACWEWCGDDPLLQIVTPSGNSVAVNVSDYVRGPEHVGALQHVTFHYTVQDISLGDGRTATLVHLEDTIPNDGSAPFQTRAVVAYGGQQLAAVDGVSGRPMRLTFILPGA